MSASISRCICLLYNISMNNQKFAQLKIIKNRVRILLGGNTHDTDGFINYFF